MLKLVGIDPTNSANEALSSDELRTIVGEAGPHIPKRHQGMLINILDLEEVSVEDIMIPRNEVVGINLQDDDETILQILRLAEFTRIPVYNDDINNIVGVLHQRNVSRIIEKEGINRQLLASEMVEPYFVPESTALHTQLVNFQKLKERMGIAVQGLVTLEDLLEEIVGEFTSNIADEVDDIHLQDDGKPIINGTTTIRDINKTLKWDLPTEGPKTLNGLLLEHLQSFPEASACVEIDNYRFEISDIKDNIIQNVKATQLERESKQDED